MKRVGLFLVLLPAMVGSGGHPMPVASQGGEAAVAGPFSPAELSQFSALAPIDTHTHVFAADPALIAMLKKLKCYGGPAHPHAAQKPKSLELHKLP